MIELQLLGIGADGGNLVLTDPDGERFELVITDELRAAVRRDRPHLESVNPHTALKPKDIQVLLRAGMTPAEIARDHDMDPAHIARFEPPIAAEKDFAIQRARSSLVGSAPDAPVMNDLVVDRLAARGVDPQTLVWSASRASDQPWMVTLTFIQGAAEHAAHWHLDPQSGQIEAVDQEAQWLTESAATPVASVVSPLPNTAEEPAAPVVSQEDASAQAHAREALLDQLNAARGRRQGIDFEVDEDQDTSDLFPDARPDATPEVAEPQPLPDRESLSARIHSLAEKGTLPPPPAPEEEPATAPVEENDPELPGLDQPSAPAKPASKNTKRRPVPSWDEIVFGTHSK